MLSYVRLSSTLFGQVRYVRYVAILDYPRRSRIMRSQRIKIPFIGRNNKKLFKTDVQTGIVPDTEKIPVYNYVSSNQRPITWNTFRKHVRAHGSKIPGVKDIRLQCMFWNSRLWVHKIFMWLFHLLPAVMVDAAAILTGRDPRSGSLLFSLSLLFFF